ncbi:MAG TPA: GMC family oxidoreductase [Rhizomicrobium sp.]|jgi:choline dehydrogenase-like flavoprotein
MSDAPDFDAIVVGSGMSGGWVAKELSEKGLKVLILERGPNIVHGTDYTDMLQPWEVENHGRVNEDEVARDYAIQSRCYAFDTATKHFWVKDSDHPYLMSPEKPFYWMRGYHLGGRSLMWGRQTYRWSDIDFEANLKDGHGVDWPIRYADIAPWYDYVERFAGISGNAEGLAQLPDGQFQPPMDFSIVEQEVKQKLEAAYPTRKMTIGRCAHLTKPTDEQTALGRIICQFRSLCERGCTFGAYFSSLSATLPAAERTGNLTVQPDSIVHSVIYDPVKKRASGVRVIDANTKAGRTITARMVFVNASTISTAALLLNSKSEVFPSGLANSSDQVGRNLMDHVSGMGASGDYPGHIDRYYFGRRPNGTYIPRYANVTEPADDFVRGFGFQGGALRGSWQRGIWEPGVGASLKAKLRNPSGWTMHLSGFGEMLPDPNNRVTLDAAQIDKWGVPLIRIDAAYGPNELKIAERANQDAKEMLERAGCVNVNVHKRDDGSPAAPLGYGIHEMGTARMGRDPKTSVLNEWNQTHDVPNLFVTDGACMASSACQNPSLTYMALSARAANHAVEILKQGVIA